MKAICYRFFHSPGVGVFFLLYGVVSCLSLISGFSSPGELFVQNLGDMGPPGLGLSVFSAVYMGAAFSRRTFQSQIAHGASRIMLLRNHFLLLTLVFLFLAYLNAGLPALLWAIWRGGMGGAYPMEYLLRLCVPAALLTTARGVGLLIFPFLFRDSVKTLMISLVYTLLISALTQSDRHIFPYSFYGPAPFPLWADIAVAILSLGILALTFGLLALYFRQTALR